MDVDMARLLHLMAHLNPLYPLILQHLLNRGPPLRVRLEHAPYQRAACPRGQVVDRRGTRRVRGLRRRTRAGVRGVELVAHLRRAPRQLLEMQAVINDAAGPDVYQPGVVRCWLRKGVWGRLGYRDIRAGQLEPAEA